MCISGQEILLCRKKVEKELDATGIYVSCFKLAYSTHYLVLGVSSANLWTFQTNDYHVTTSKSSTSLSPLAINSKCFTGKHLFAQEMCHIKKLSTKQPSWSFTRKKVLKKHCFVPSFKEYHSSGIAETSIRASEIWK